MHFSLQRARPFVHVTIPDLQVPASHVPWQTLPHSPQLFSSVRMSTQVSLQGQSPAGQRFETPVHPPSTQLPVMHALPHSPQLRGSVFRSAHSPLHNDSEPVQGTGGVPMHEPFAHVPT